MSSRVHGSSDKSNIHIPINTTLVSRKQTAQPVNTPHLDNPEFLKEKERKTEPKNSETVVQKFSPSSPEQPQEGDKNKTQLQQQPELRTKSQLQQPKADILTKIKTLSSYGFDFNKIAISAPNRPLKTPPIQPRLKVSIPPRNRLQQQIDQRREETLSKKLETKVNPSSTTASDAPDSKNSGDNSNWAVQAGAKLVAERNKKRLSLQQFPLKLSPLKPKVLRKPLVATPWQERINTSIIQRNRLQPRAGRQQQELTAPSTASADLETSIQQTKGGGQPLADSVREPTEQSFGADFSEVKIHTDSQANELNHAIQARPFTTGQDIFFRQGEYNRENRSGQGLLAHELTHVVQQTGEKKVQKAPNKLSPHKLKNLLEDNGTALEPKSINTISSKPNKIQFKVAEESANNIQAKQPEKPEPQNSEIDTGKPLGNQGEKPPNSQNSKAKDLSNTTEGNKKAPKENPSAKTPAKAQKVTNLEKSRGGNTGKAAALGKEATDTEAKAEPGAKAPTSPEADPAFQAVVGKAKKVAQKEKEHEPATTKADQAQAAAVAPPSEVESKGQANQMGEMEQAETPGFDKVAFKNQLMERIEETAPENLEEADDFKDNNKLESVKGELSGKVKEEQEGSQKPLEDKSKEAPDTSGIEPKPVTPLPPTQPGAAPSSVGAEGAVPKSKGKGEVEAPLQENSKQLDQKMAGADVTEEQLAKSNEPQFKAALTAKKDAKSDASQAPQAYRQSEEAELSQAQGEAVATSEGKLQGMHGDRAKLLTQVVGKQTEGKGKDEQSRAKVADDIQNIYSETKTKVESILSGLDQEVETAFDSGAAIAQQLFEDYVDVRMSAYKAERYSGLGAARWVTDKLLGMPPEVNTFYQEGRELFLKEMDRVIDKVVDIIGDGLSQAKNEIANGRKRVQDYVDQLPANLKSIGQEAASDIQSEFDSLEESVDAKQDELIDKLAQKYQENVQALDARIEEMKAANQGLVDKAANYISGVIETINKLKEMLTKVLAKVADVVGKIIKDPIGFLGNLVKGLKQGFDNFAGNIGKHLQAGLIGWLTGAMGGVGIQILDDIFSLKGIFNLVVQILGLTWDYIRNKAVKLFGARVVATMETGSEIFQALMEGPDALWEYVKGQFGDLKETVIGAIKEMVITQVITAGIKWIIGLLNPAGAFIKAAMAIYEIIMFFVNNAARIIDLINAIVDAVAAIARGAIGAAAKLVENALAKALPVVIGFLASLLGVSGLAKKVQAIVKKVRKRIDKAIDKMLMKAKKAVKKLFKGKKGKAGKGKKEKEGKFTQQDRTAGLAAFEKEEKPFIKNKSITQKDAQKVGKIVKKKHPVFKSITVVDGKDSWNYKYIFRSNKDTGTPKAEEEVRMPPVELTFRCNQKYFDPQEFQRQLKGQEDGLNNMKVSDWEKNRNLYLERQSKGQSGRSTEGSKAQKYYRAQKTQELIAQEIEQQTRQGIPKEEAKTNAEEKVTEFMKTQAALHDPDQVAGGNPTNITGLGDARTNSSIGSQWRQQVNTLQSEVDAIQGDKTNLYMNVKLEMEKFSKSR